MSCFKNAFIYKRRGNLRVPYDNHLVISKVVKSNSKAPFSIATTPRCRGGHYSFPWIAPLYP